MEMEQFDVLEGFGPSDSDEIRGLCVESAFVSRETRALLGSTADPANVVANGKRKQEGTDEQKTDLGHGRPSSAMLKRQRRLIRNRISAQLHRDRKKKHVGALETRIKHLTSENSALLGTLEEKTKEVARLREKLEKSELELQALKGNRYPSSDDSLSGFPDLCSSVSSPSMNQQKSPRQRYGWKSASKTAACLAAIVLTVSVLSTSESPGKLNVTSSSNRAGGSNESLIMHPNESGEVQVKQEAIHEAMRDYVDQIGVREISSLRFTPKAYEMLITSAQTPHALQSMEDKEDLHLLLQISHGNPDRLESSSRLHTVSRCNTK